MKQDKAIELAAKEILAVEGFIVKWPLSDEGRTSMRWLSAVAKAKAAFSVYEKCSAEVVGPTMTVPRLATKEAQYLAAMVARPQPNFGKGRVCCHNSLVSKGLARFVQGDAMVEITPEGRNAIEKTTK